MLGSWQGVNGRKKIESPCSKGIDEPSMLRSRWCCCIRRDSSRWSSFWPTMLPNISGCLKLKRCVGLANRCLQTSERWSNLCSLIRII